LFGLVEGVIRQADEIGQRGVLIRRQAGDAAAHGDVRADLGGGIGYAQRLDPAPQVVGHLDRSIQVGHGQDDGELLAPVAGDGIPGTGQAIGHGVGHRLEAGIARLVSVGVVEILEPVDVHHDHRQRCPGADSPLPLLVDALVELPPVGDPGQRIQIGEFQQRSVGVLELPRPGVHQFHQLVLPALVRLQAEFEADVQQPDGQGG